MRITTWGAPRAFGALLVLSLLALMVAAGGSAARAPQAADTEGLIQPAWTPMGLRNDTTTVMVQVAGEPVAAVEGNANRELSGAEKNQIESNLKATQAGVAAAVEKLGGTVVADYQAAYSGLKVRINRNRTDDIAKLANVVAVRPLQVMRPDNVRGVALIGAPAVWAGALGLHGEHIKIAVIDTGIDYTHANFGGPGTTAAYDAANATDTLPANASLFGPAAPRVKGGTDLVGDAYDAGADAGSPALIPHPDPNPLDCNGHGSHVAGTAAGSGVLANGHTYTGTYDANTISGNSWTVGPGVAPKADIYSVRVFGCEGSTDVTVDAIEWAVDHDMDVINMSLGSSFGSADDPSAVASTNAARAGVIVVASAGNSGPNQYITGSPATADGALSVAANDPIASSPGATLALSTGQTISVLNANAATFANGTVYPIAVLRTSYPSGAVALGCSQAEYTAYPGSLAGKLVVTQRGTCSRVARPIFAQQNGAAASAMIDTSTGYPPFEGPITGSAETGPYNVTIPFFGVRGLAASSTSDGGKLRLADNGTATATNAPLPNANFKGFASFSSGGPRTGDSFLKPDVTAPGVSIVSTASGTGNGATTLSGTSMASPHAAGVAVLTKQAHPEKVWKVRELKAAIINTADPAGVFGYSASRGGSGLVQPALSTKTGLVAYSEKGLGISLNFGYAELKEDYSKTLTMRVRNLTPHSGTYNVSATLPSGSPHSISIDEPSFSVGGFSDHFVNITLNVPAATAGSSVDPGLSFHEVAGLIEVTPSTPELNNGIKARVPYYFVPRALSDVKTKLGSKLKPSNPTTTANITNENGVIAGDADFYAWGLSDGKDAGRVSNDVRGIGVQTFPFNATNQLLVFAVNTYDRWSNASTNEFDISVDVDNDGRDDYVIVGIDDGAVRTGTFSGRLGSFVFSTRSGGASSVSLATAPTDSATAELVLLSSQLCRAGEPCLNAANPRFTYKAASFDLAGGGVDEVDGSAKFNAWSPAISTGGFQTVAPGGTAQETIAVNAAEWALTPALGLMVVSLDNKSKNGGESQLIPVDFK